VKSKGLSILLGIVGLAVLCLGLGRTIADIIKSLHATGNSNTTSVSLDFSLVWLGAAAVGVALCVWSYFLYRRRVSP
jgi:hypothetical protein